MSDLTATNCGCNEGNGCGSMLWILILLCCCNNNMGFGNFNLGDNNCCLPILMLLLCGNCGGGSGTIC